MYASMYNECSITFEKLQYRWFFKLRFISLVITRWVDNIKKYRSGSEEMSVMLEDSVAAVTFKVILVDIN